MVEGGLEFKALEAEDFRYKKKISDKTHAFDNTKLETI